MPVDYSKYPANWFSELRPKVLERAGHCCEGTPKNPGCRVENYTDHPKTGSKVVLTIAHMDRNIKNNNLSNLRALCQRCHLAWDVGQHVASRKYGKEHDGPHQKKLFSKDSNTSCQFHPNRFVRKKPL